MGQVTHDATPSSPAPDYIYSGYVTVTNVDIKMRTFNANYIKLIE